LISVIDYGAGNLRSVNNALLKLGFQPETTSSPEVVLNSSAVIFPGVGAAADAMQYLRESGLDEAIRDSVNRGRPFLAICLGMQILLSASEEGGFSKCLGLIPGTVKELPSGLKVPHMGWNQVKQTINHPVFNGIPDDSNFYFVHSYHTVPELPEVVAGTTEYGINICSVLVRDNLVATQFHPEKSGDLGLRFYANFLEWALGTK